MNECLWNRSFKYGMILLTLGAMLIGFWHNTHFLLRRKYSITKLEVGFGPISVLEIIICLFIIGITFLYIVIGRNITNVILFTIAIFQNIGVAIFEEYFSKGILFFIAKKITSNKVIIVLICSCVFAFVLHSSDSFMTNLEYRLPMSVILGVCYLKTNNLYLPITLHLVNNLLATSLLKKKGMSYVKKSGFTECGKVMITRKDKFTYNK